MSRRVGGNGHLYYISSNVSHLGYEVSVLRGGQNVVVATMKIYNSAILSFLPTPAKSHYVFNLRCVLLSFLFCIFICFVFLY